MHQSDIDSEDHLSAAQGLVLAVGLSFLLWGVILTVALWVAQ